MSGHVFVIQGSLARLDYDAVIVATDEMLHVGGHYAEVLNTNVDANGRSEVGRLRPPDWTKGHGRALEPQPGMPRQPTWFIDAARYQGQSDTEALDGLKTRLAATLRHIADAGLPAGHGRPHPLVALPTLGTGRGGFGSIRGKVIDALLETCQEAVNGAQLDIVIVADNRSDYTAFQSRRRLLPHDARHLGTALQDEAQKLADLAKQEHLALFLGAGVGIAAGLPAWQELVADLGAANGVDFGELESDLDKAELLQVALGERFGADVVRRIELIERYAITHAILASLGCREVVTTNYDHLFERAASDVAGGVEIPALPFDQTLPGTPWVLKMHGDIREPDSIVLTRSAFVGYDAKSRPMGSMVQSLMITKHLLVVGASMKDDNFLRLAHEVFAFRVAAHGPIGTVVTLAQAPGKARLYANHLTFVPISEADRVPDQARHLAIFLDLVAMLTSASGHLLDARYDNMLAPDRERAAALSARRLFTKIENLSTGDSDAWRSLLDAIEQLGGKPPAR